MKTRHIINYAFCIICVIYAFFIVTCQSQSTDTQNKTNQTNITAKKNLKKDNDWLCVPGKRIGPITADLTEADLHYIFGADKVKRDSISIGKGKYIEGTKVLGGTADELRIVWDSNHPPFTKIKRIIIDKIGGTWATKEGLTVGASLSDVIAANKVDFTFIGFKYPHAGSVFSWEGGTIKAEEMSLRLAFRTDVSTLEPTELAKVTDQEEVSSAEPILQKMKVEVMQMFFFF